MAGARWCHFFTGVGSCQWNAANNNDVWVRMTPNASGTACIALSGLDVSLQSIVVNDPNTDGDNNPCTCGGCGNGQYWNVVFCPRNAIYGSTAGTGANQQHCFPVTAGQAYYLVVDGNGGAESSLMISEVSNLLNPLPVELGDFWLQVQSAGVELNWLTLSELNNAGFTVMGAGPEFNFQPIGYVAGVGTSPKIQQYQFIDPNPLPGLNLYRLRQEDFNCGVHHHQVLEAYVDGREIMLATQLNGDVWQGYNGSETTVALQLINLARQEVWHQQLQTKGTFTIHADMLPAGIYVLQGQTEVQTYSWKLLRP